MGDYAYVAHSPFTSWPHGAFTIDLAKEGYAASIDFDANDDGTFDDPVKVVDNVR